MLMVGYFLNDAWPMFLWFEHSSSITYALGGPSHFSSVSLGSICAPILNVLRLYRIALRTQMAILQLFLFLLLRG